MLGLVIMHDCGVGVDQESDVPLEQKRHKAVQEAAWTEQGPGPRLAFGNGLLIEYVLVFLAHR